MNKAPLAGIKVIEIAGIGPGPCAGMMLADMGAEVILIERKSPNANAAASTDQAKQTFYNRGKQSIQVDLKQAAGVELVLDLVKGADVLIEGFRPGVMERLGLGPESCHEVNPKLVYGRMTGWGQYGPLAHAAGHDPNYVAISGALWYGGRSNQAPSAPLTLTGDTGGGTMILLWGVMCALMDVQRGGSGQVVDAAITDGSAYISSLLWMMRNTGQVRDELGHGWADGGSPWNDTFECADGKFATICALEPQFYAELIERLDLKDDPAFAKQWDTTEWPEAKQKMAKVFKQKTQQQWIELLEGTDVCFGPVLNLTEAAQHPHNKARETFTELDGVVQPSPAPKLSAYKPKLESAPVPGAQTDSVLRELGLDGNAIAMLREQGVV